MGNTEKQNWKTERFNALLKQYSEDLNYTQELDYALRLFIAESRAARNFSIGHRQPKANRRLPIAGKRTQSETSAHCRKWKRHGRVPSDTFSMGGSETSPPISKRKRILGEIS